MDGVLHCPSHPLSPPHPVTPSPRPAQQRGCSACLQPAARGPALSRFTRPPRLPLLWAWTGQCPGPAPRHCAGCCLKGSGSQRDPCDMDAQPGAGTWAPPSPHAAVPTPERWIGRWALGGAFMAGPLSWGGTPQSPLPRGTWAKAEMSPRHTVGQRLVPGCSRTQ